MLWVLPKVGTVLSKQLLLPPALDSLHESYGGLESSRLLAPAQSAHLAFNVLPIDCCIWKPGIQGRALSLLKPASLPQYMGPRYCVPPSTPSLLLWYQTTIPVYIPQGLLRPNKDNAALFFSALVRPLWCGLFMCGLQPLRGPSGWRQAKRLATQSVVQWPEASTSSGNLLQMQTLGLHTRSAESAPAFYKVSRWFWCTRKSRHHWLWRSDSQNRDFFGLEKGKIHMRLNSCLKNVERPLWKTE